MRKAIVYARFSFRKNENECESIEAQFDFCRKYCKDNDIEIVAEFSDRALSDGDEDRPGLWAAIHALKKGYLLVVYRLDRLARSVYLSVIIERTIKKRNATFLSSIGERTWNDSNEDFRTRNLLQEFAEFEHRVISARTSAVMLRHQVNGRLMGSIPPYGWQLDPENPKRIIENPKERIIANQILRLRRKGLSLRKIAAELHRLNYLPRKVRKKFKGRTVYVKGHWQPQTISAILKRMKK